MRLFSPVLLALSLPSIYAQSSTSTSSTSPSASRSSLNSSSSTTSRSNSSSSSHSATPTLNITTFTTTLTTYPTTTTLSESFQPATTLTLSFTLNTSDYSSVNQSIWQGDYTNGTTPFNGTDKPWEEGDGFLPFKIKIDPAFGVLGGLLIISGIPVAVLGGKNRWSSNAISTGYALMLFTLVMVLRFGVEPNLQPPSPNPPSTTLRGLYLLACIIASFFGAAAGIFLYSFAKYWVSAIGGFTFGWFLLATRQGGLIDSVLGRWGLLGALTVGGLISSLPKQTNEWMMLISTSWIGATAFTLGVDCYTRAGLKEFYMYNLGFHDLFPKLYGFKYPLTQTMMIELGLLAAMVVIGAAIQFRVLGMLTKRLNKMREEEEERIEAEEIEKAAERFKNVGAELNEWEEKHGASSSASGPGSSGPTDPYGSLNGSALRATRESVLLPQLGFEFDRERDRDYNYGRPSSTLSLLRDPEMRNNGNGNGSYEPLSIKSPTLNIPDTPQSMFIGLEELKPAEPIPSSPTGSGSDSELEQKMRLLAEIKKAREDVKGSLDKLRSSTPSGSVSIESDYLLGSGRNTTPTPTLGVTGTSDRRERHTSTASSRILDYSYPASKSDNSGERRDRHLSTTSSGILDYPMSTTGVHHSTSTSPPTPPPQSDWDRYLSERKVISPTSNTQTPETYQSMQTPQNGTNPRDYPQRSSTYTSGPLTLDMDVRRERTTSMLEPRVSDFGSGPGPGPRDSSRLNGTYPFDRPTGNMSRTRSEGLDRIGDGDRPKTYHDYLGGNNGNLGTPMIIGSAANARADKQNQRTRPANSGRTAMTYDELAERHRKRLSKLQDPVTSKMKEEIEIENARKRWEKQKQLEKQGMKRKERERFYREQEQQAGGGGLEGPAAGGAGPGVEGNKGKAREQGINKAEEWRKSVILSPPTISTQAPTNDKAREQKKIDQKKRASRSFAS
ncbi:uncharacterized protein IL334_004773 [Kwoniella shivajii]|uniref:TM7S3/TM198-like domain-containing protein n=1 Tax=Kwoniella shivajii TaxID=564305 RepID=A0ABZ1D2P2_9TREE|nr:hypothetical protein IL334_004773 [Kwoniella shivajii]